MRWPSTSTMHWRQAPTGSSSGWSQNRGTWMPTSSAARMISVPLGTLISMPSMVSVDHLDRRRRGVAASGFVTVMRQAPAVANRVEAVGSNGQPPCSQCATYSSRKYCTDDVIGLVAPSPSAQNDRPMMLSQASSSVSMSLASALPASSRSRICTIQ